MSGIGRQGLRTPGLRVVTRGTLQTGTRGRWRGISARRGGVRRSHYYYFYDYYYYDYYYYYYYYYFCDYNYYYDYYYYYDFYDYYYYYTGHSPRRGVPPLDRSRRTAPPEPRQSRTLSAARGTPKTETALALSGVGLAVESWLVLGVGGIGSLNEAGF